MRAEHGPFTIIYKGGRLADIYHAESPTALDAIQVAQYDWEAGEVVEEIEQPHLHDALVRWADDHGDEFTRHHLT